MVARESNSSDDNLFLVQQNKIVATPFSTLRELFLVLKDCKKMTTISDRSKNDKGIVKSEHDARSCSPFLDKINFNALDGIRGMLCYGVVQFHTHYLNGVAIFLRESPCAAAIINVPIMGEWWFRRTTFQMASFWVISGMLIECELHQLLVAKVNKRKQELQMEDEKEKSPDVEISWTEFGMVFLNRMVRIYPLYLLLQLLAWAQSIKLNANGPTAYTWRDFVANLLFVKQWDPSNFNLAAVGWSMQVTVHGFIAIILLFAMTYKYTYLGPKRNLWMKQYILIAWFIVSVLHAMSYRPFPWQHLSEEAVTSIEKYGFRGIEIATDSQIKAMGIDDLGGKQKLYPHFDFGSNVVRSVQAYITSTIRNTYVSSILNHGNGMMLGSLMYLNFYDRNGEPFYPGWKVLLSIFLLWITGGWYITASAPMYFLIEGMLTWPVTSKWYATPSKADNIFKTIFTFVPQTAMIIWTKYHSLPMWKILYRYTYAIFLFHFFPIVVRSKALLPIRYKTIKEGAEAGIEACTAMKNAGMEYNMVYVVKTSVINFIFAIVIAIFCYHVIERPAVSRWKQFLKKNMMNRSNVSHKNT